MKKLLILLTLSVFSNCFSQTELVFVFFKDKPNKASFFDNPLTELSQKSLDRRTNLGIALNDQDAPIETTYIQNVKNLGFTGDMAIQNKMFSKTVESAQRKVEGNNFDIRKQLLNYDDVMNNQREIMYGKRNEICFFLV